MRFTKKLTVAAIAATALFSALATSATARQFEVSNQQIRAVFTPLVFFNEEGSRVSCTVTLEGSFHSRIITKFLASLLGYITRAIANTPGCRSEGPLGVSITVSVLPETLPWHVLYNDFTGSLPSVIPRVRIVNAGFDLLVVPLVGTCKYRVTPRVRIGGPRGGPINEGGATMFFEPAENHMSSTPFCPEGRFEGRAPIWLLGTTTAITMRLI